MTTTYKIEKANPTDSAKILEFMKVIGSETDNLIFGSEGLKGVTSAEGQKRFLQKFLDEPWYGSYLIAKNQKGEIIGYSYSHTHPRKRVIHCYDFEIAVLKKYQNQGTGTELAKKAIKHLKNNTYCKRLTTHSLLDETKALKFLKKLGFEIEATLKKSIKINNKYLDQYLLKMLFD